MTDTTVAPAPALDAREIEKRVGQYIAIRDRLDEMNAEHDERCKKLKATQNLLSGLMLAYLEQAGATSIKTPEGTCIASSKTTASLADPKAFMDFVIANSAWDLLDRKANSTAVRDYVAEKGHLPPGANLSTIRTLSVRRSSK